MVSERAAATMRLLTETILAQIYPEKPLTFAIILTHTHSELHTHTRDSSPEGTDEIAQNEQTHTRKKEPPSEIYVRQ